MFSNIEKLEFDRIKEMLKRSALSEHARVIIDETDFSTDRDEVESRLQCTVEARDLYLKQDDFAVNHVYDLDELLSGISKSQYYHEPVLYKKLQRMLEDIGRVRKVLEKHTEYPLLHEYTFSLFQFGDIVALINAKIDDDGAIKDTASPELKRLFAEEAKLRKHVEKQLHEMLGRYKADNLLQEDYVTLRNDRYVFPVKSANVRQVKGIVQGSSATGGTVYVEPLAVIDLNNDLQSIRFRIEAEKRAIIYDLGKRIHTDIRDIMISADTFYYLDFLLAKVRFALDCNAVKPIVTTDGMIAIYRGRHPLLDKKTVVPIDMYFKEGKKGLVITGPNAGGKTVALKTVGLFTLMTMYGMLIPAEAMSAVSLFENIFVDIGDFQSIEANLSTFSGHVSHLSQFARDVSANTLVLLDEVGVGTDPEEGAALAMSLIDHFLDNGATVITTTHYNALKRHSMEDARLENASCLFDYDNIQPLFTIKIGIPGSSNGLLVAKKLGMPVSVIDRAYSLMDTTHIKLEETITRLEHELATAEILRAKYERENVVLEEKMTRYERELEDITKKRTRKKLESLLDFENEFMSIRSELNRIVKSIREGKADEETLKMAQASAVDAIEKAQQERKKAEEAIEKITDPQPGDMVHLEKFGVQAKVISFDAKKNEYELEMNGKMIKIKKADMRGHKVKQAPKKQPTERVYLVESANKFIGQELVVVGMTCDDALDKLEDFLSYALLKNFEMVRIVHGVGSGVLRRAIHDYLKHYRPAKSYKYENNRGVTTEVWLK